VLTKSAIPVTGTGAEVEDQVAIEAGAEVATEVVRIGLIIAILIAPGGRHRARPALALTLLTTKVILTPNDLIHKVPLDLQIFTTAVAQIRIDPLRQPEIGPPILLHPSTEKPPGFAETSHQTDLLQNDKGLEVLPHVDAGALCLHHVQTSGRQEIEALHSGNEVAGTRLVVVRDEDLLEEVVTAVEKTAVAPNLRGQEDLGHLSMIGDSTFHLTVDLVPLVVTTTGTTIATTDLTIGQLRGIPFTQIQDSLHPLTPQGAIRQ
jgi:hypothetical protein